MKKALKILGVILLLLIAALVAIPFFLESKVDSIVQNYADENLNADLSFDDISLSLISSFPKAEVSVENLKIINRAPFEGETFVSAKALSFEMGLMQLFKGTEDPLIINEIIADELLLVVKTNQTGAVNYDITKATSEEDIATTAPASASGFSFDIDNYELNNSAITYLDEASNMAFYLTEINHSGKGILSGTTSELDTKTEANVSFAMDGTEYLSNNSIKLDALIDLDLEQQKYTFKENKGYINALPLEFDGYVQLVDAGQQIDITFKNPESSFKDFLALIPKTYAKSIEDVTTTGNFTVDGIVKGLVSDETIPTLDINMRSDNASFKFPQLPKSVRNIMIDVAVKNTTGHADDTFVDINKLNFQIDEDIFNSEIHLKNLTGNMLVDANIDGVLNLANITKAYPIELETALSGLLNAKINTGFDMNAIDTNAYQRIRNNGSLSLTNFVFSSDAMANPLQINKANLTFNAGNVSLNSFDAVTGKTDLSATGTITNLLGYVLSDKNLEGNFNLNSKTFALADFMSENEVVNETTNKTAEASKTESIKIPAFLDCTITANANTVIYDNLNLKNVKGQLIIKDQNVNLNNLTTDIFGGQLGISGNVSTKNETPTFDVNLGMQSFDISQSFKELELLNSLAPIASVIEGKLNSTISLSGLLDGSLTPNLSTISGNALAEVLTRKVESKKSPLLSSLDGKLNFLNLDKLNLKDLKTKLSFENGQVAVSPFTITIEDIPVEISGAHGFDNKMNYNAVLQVPAKYLGSDVNRLIGKINDNEVNKISIPVTANIGGSFTIPSIKTDLTSGVANLTQQLVEIEKQKLIGKGKNEVKNLLGGLLGGKTPTTIPTDSTATPATNTTTQPNTKAKVKEGVNSILGGLLSGKKKSKTEKVPDSTKN
jgi:hypothetical protein